MGCYILPLSGTPCKICPTIFRLADHAFPKGLAEYVNKRDFSSVRRSNTRGEPADWYRLATVDAAILNAVGGVVAARKVTKREEGQKRRKMPKDESEDESEPEDPYIILARGLLRASTAFGAIERKR